MKKSVTVRSYNLYLEQKAVEIRLITSFLCAPCRVFFRRFLGKNRAQATKQVFFHLALIVRALSRRWVLLLKG
jgi:hypothetical protein